MDSCQTLALEGCFAGYSSIGLLLRIERGSNQSIPFWGNSLQTLLNGDALWNIVNIFGYHFDSNCLGLTIHLISKLLHERKCRIIHSGIRNIFPNSNCSKTQWCINSLLLYRLDIFSKLMNQTSCSIDILAYECYICRRAKVKEMVWGT